MSSFKLNPITGQLDAVYDPSEDLWNRTGTVLDTHTANDSVHLGDAYLTINDTAQTDNRLQIKTSGTTRAGYWLQDSTTKNAISVFRIEGYSYNSSGLDFRQYGDLSGDPGFTKSWAIAAQAMGEKVQALLAVAHSSQTEDIFGVTDSSLNNYFAVDKDGYIEIGYGEAGIDPKITFNGETNTGVITWMEDEAYFDFSHPIVISDQTLLASPVAGAIEFDNDRMYLTNVGTQRAIDRTSDVITSTTTVTNTTTETTIFTASIPANSLKAGNIIKGRIAGVLTNATAADDIIIRLKYGSTTVQTFNPAIGNVTDEPWHVEGDWTIRTVGAAGTLASHTHIDINGFDESVVSTGSIDTTASEDITVTVEWDNAKAGNTISIYTGFAEYKN